MNEEGKELTVDFLMQQLEIEDCNAHHKSLSQLDSSTSVNFAAYDCRQNKGKNTKKNRRMERIGDRIILEHKDLLILVISLEIPRNGGQMHEMWKTGTPARAKVSSQECQVQRLP